MLPIKKILLLDDSPDVHEYVEEILTMIPELDFELTIFDNFDAAIADIRTTSYDLCLVDFDIKDPQKRTGIDFIRETISVHPYQPLILLSGSSDDKTIFQGAQVGAVDYIEKGNLRPASLISSIRYALRRSATLKELHTLYQQVTIISQMRSDIIRLAAHDIKSPLSTFFMSLEMLNNHLDHSPNEFVKKHVDRMTGASRRIKAIVDDIMALDYMDEHGEFERTEIVPLINSVIREFRLMETLENKTLTFEQPQQLPVVRGIPGQLREVVFNLLTNAIKYTRDDGQIEIDVNCGSENVTVKVKDNGFGIPADQHDLLFKPFTRIDLPETQAIEGTGLGLYLVKRIIDRHDGEMFFKSTYGQGSMFGFSLAIV